MRESDIQNSIRESISRLRIGVSFRTNVGQAWTGDEFQKQSDGNLLIINPRPFKTGLPEGFSDLLIVQSIEITPTMIGQTMARAGFLEIKTPKGKPTDAQLNFIAQMQALGAAAGVARSPDDALTILARR